MTIAAEHKTREALAMNRNRPAQPKLHPLEQRLPFQMKEPLP